VRRAGVLAAIAVLLAAALTPLAVRADDALVLVGGNFPPSVADVEDIVADKAGYYAAEHLSVTKEFAANAGACFAAVSTGKGDICSSSVEAVIQGYARGVRLQFFLARHPMYDYTLAVAGTSPIRTLADFRGKTIGETGSGGVTEASTDALLATAGLHKGDYAYLPISRGAEALTALTAGKVDAVSFPMQELAIFHAATGMTFRLFPNPRLADIRNSGFGVSPQTLASKPDQLRRFARAMVKAYIFVRVNPRASARMFLEATNQKITPDALDLIAREIEALEPLFPAYDLMAQPIGAMNADGIERYCRFFQDAGATPDLVPGAALVTDQFIGFANDFDRKAVIAEAKARR
jgi:NitT/TauT family transport system substrate-binding protein